MVNGVRLKVCGLTNRDDAEVSAKLGADYLGFILYPSSPRHLTLASFASLGLTVSTSRKVAVVVEPEPAELVKLKSAGFDFFQVHFRPELALSVVASWMEVVGPERLWLAPKLPPALDLPDALLPFARTFLLDTFDPTKFGGSGATGDWAKFARHQRANPNHSWMLSGGLNPSNIRAALTDTRATAVDVNSGVEMSPGKKHHGRLRALVDALQSHT